MLKVTTTLIAAFTVIAVSTVHAAPVAEIALDNPSVQALDGSLTPVFNGATHTGSLLFTPTPSTFAFISFNDVQQPVAWASFTSPALTAMTGSTLPVPYATAGELVLVNGNVAGGAINVVLSNGDTFSTTIKPNSGSVIPIAGGFSIAGELNTASFSGNTFGGIDVSAFAGIHGGTFRLSNFSPNINGLDEFSELDLRLDVPEPASVALFGLGTALIAWRRR